MIKIGFKFVEMKNRFSSIVISNKQKKNKSEKQKKVEKKFGKPLHVIKFAKNNRKTRKPHHDCVCRDRKKL